MKKIMTVEQYDKAKNVLKRISLTALADLIISATLTACNKKNQNPNISSSSIEYNQGNKIEIDDILLELADLDKDGKAPKGFIVKGNVCYRLESKTGIAPAGYVLGTDAVTLCEVDTELRYEIPTDENTILVGSKEVYVIKDGTKFEYTISEATPRKGYSK